MSLLLLMCLVVSSSAQSLPLNKILFTPDFVEEYGCRCLDDTPSGYYFRAGVPKGSTSWVIFLEGGGLCVTPEDCYQRLNTSQGSSNDWPDTHVDNTGLLSTEDFNPFSSFNHVWIPYCSGDTHTGTLREPDLLGFIFAGHLTVNAVFEHLRLTTDISKATNILLAGGSAGGIGVYNNADFIRDKFPHAKVKASPQGGYFFPESVVLYEEWKFGINVPYPPEASEYLSTIFSSAVDETCARAFPFTKGLCWDAAFVLPYIETPVFVVNNIYDSSQLMYLGWYDDGSSDSKGYLSYFGDTLVRSVLKNVNSTSKDGYFLISCYDHTGNLCMASPTTIQNISYAQALEDWFYDVRSFYLVDSCWKPGGLPCNPSCPSMCDPE